MRSPCFNPLDNEEMFLARNHDDVYDFCTTQKF